MRLFAVRGFTRTTTAEIAKAAGMSPRTFFRHFPSKHDLIEQPYRLLLSAVASGARACPTDEPIIRSVVAVWPRCLASLLGPDVLEHDGRAGIRSLLALRNNDAEVSAMMWAITDEFRSDLATLTSARLRTDPVTDPRPSVAAGAASALLHDVTLWWSTSPGVSLPDAVRLMGARSRTS
ncbi:TetR/AcrR family transcriptional regulator [Herbihabitans rhizosphaerae]|nr:TetR/AcrR family transcriptional regulator [Herbihabitans rhizosphaerae]